MRLCVVLQSTGVNFTIHRSQFDIEVFVIKEYNISIMGKAKNKGEVTQ